MNHYQVQCYTVYIVTTYLCETVYSIAQLSSCSKFQSSTHTLRQPLHLIVCILRVIKSLRQQMTLILHCLTPYIIFQIDQKQLYNVNVSQQPTAPLQNWVYKFSPTAGRQLPTSSATEFVSKLPIKVNSLCLLMYAYFSKRTESEL